MPCTNYQKARGMICFVCEAASKKSGVLSAGRAGSVFHSMFRYRSYFKKTQEVCATVGARQVDPPRNYKVL